MGRLAGPGRLLLIPHLFLQPYPAPEALASGRIEGTQASLSDVFDAPARETAKGPVREVTNYIQALEHGLARPAHLLSQNWVGSPDSRPEAAVFVPPPSVTTHDGHPVPQAGETLLACRQA